MSGRCRRRAGVAALGAMAAASMAADWTGDAVARYGGEYAADCSNPASPRLRATPEGLAVAVGPRRMTGRQVEIAVDPGGGQQPQPGVEVVTLLSTVKGGHALSFWVHREPTGQFIEIEADPAVAQALGPDVVGKRFQDCDAARSQRAADEARRQVRQTPADAARPASGPAGEARFRAAWRQALGPLAAQAGWLLSQVGRPTDTASVTIADTQYRQFTGCKPHDCGDNNALVLYAPQTGAIAGKVLVQGQARYIGAPSAAMTSAIERLWQAEWRQGR